jgi:hypothetical protein
MTPPENHQAAKPERTPDPGPDAQPPAKAAGDPEYAAQAKAAA